MKFSNLETETSEIKFKSLEVDLNFIPELEKGMKYLASTSLSNFQIGAFLVLANFLLVEATLALLDQAKVNFTPRKFLDREVYNGFKKFEDINEVARQQSLKLFGIVENEDYTDIVSKVMSEVIIGPILEEIVCRGIIQELLLRKLPEKAINLFGYNGQSVVDNATFRVARVFLSASIFALTHTDCWPVKNGGTIPQLIGGVTSGILTEKGKFLLSVNEHVMWNMMCCIGERVATSLSKN